MSRRLVLITEIIAPYRIPLFNALARRADVHLHVVFLAETDPSLRQWQIYKDEIQFSYEVLPSWRRRFFDRTILLNRGVMHALTASSPDAIMCGGYNYLASWQALAWARLHKIPFFLWSESNLQDLRSGRPWFELLKREFLRSCSGFVVPGESARQYLRSHKIRDEYIFTARNAVDNDLFAENSDRVRRNPDQYRQELNLPLRFYLFVGRLVRDKGVFDLLAAYAKLDERLREKTGLVFVGDGVSRRALQDEANAVSPGMIRFAGFAQRDELAKYYALADVFILPTHSDPWGLVVNEAMACGLPIILSDIAGCAPDLVLNDWNGILVKPGDISSLVAAMGRLGRDQELCAEMGTRSRLRISAYSPAEWASGVVTAIYSTRREA